MEMVDRGVIESVADAIRDAAPRGYGILPSEAEKCARAAIAALRETEPTRDMYEAGIKALHDPANRHGAVLDEVFRAYLDAALASSESK